MAVVIMAGGGGTRLWPISRRATPKQHQRLISKKTLLQESYDRLKRTGFKSKDIYVSSTQAAWPTLRRELPRVNRKNFFLEPERRDTAAAIGYAAMQLYHADPHNLLTTANSDTVVKDERRYAQVIKAAQAEVVRAPERCVLIGVPPTYPETGYGYIEVGKRLGQSNKLVKHHVKRFKEKPDFKTAAKYVSSGRFLWNPAIFTWRVDHLLQLFRRHLPKHYQALERIRKSFGSSNEAAVTRAAFKAMPKISIDYGIMENDRNLTVFSASLGWIDVGHWRSVHAAMSKQDSDNVVCGRHIGIETQGIYAVLSQGKILATAGVSDLVIIDTPDALLVCSRNHAQDVKLLVERLQEEKLERYL